MSKRPKHRGSRHSAPKLQGTKDAGALMREAVTWQSRGRPDQAIKLLDQILVHYPGNADAIHMGCVARIQHRDYTSALQFLEKWAHHPQSQGAAAQYFAGYGYYLLKHFRSALDHLEPVARQTPQFGLARLLVAKILAETGKTKAARAELTSSPEITSQSPADMMTHANVLALLDQHEDARHRLLALLQAGSMDAECLYELVRLPSRTWPSDIGKRVAQSLGKPGLTVQQRTLLEFSSGRIADHERRYADAFSHFAEAKKLTTKPFDFATFELALEQAEKASATMEISPRADTADLTPVFILGLPRSGKTIVEDLLAGRHEVTACGEIVPRLFIDANIFVETEMQQPAGNKDRLRALKPGRLDALANQYVNGVRSQFPVTSNTRYITNTLPHNAFNIHVLRLLFPNAKYISVSRNKFDTFIFSFMRHFQNQFDFTRDFATWNRYNQLYAKQVQHWRDRLGSNLLTVRYEDVVGSPKSVMQSLSDFLRLSESEATDDSKLSGVQLTTDYIDHWRHYADHLPTDRSD